MEERVRSIHRDRPPVVSKRACGGRHVRGAAADQGRHVPDADRGRHVPGAVRGLHVHGAADRGRHQAGEQDGDGQTPHEVGRPEQAAAVLRAAHVAAGVGHPHGRHTRH